MPFYSKEGESWTRIGQNPVDVHVGKHEEDFVEVFPVVTDPEQIRIMVHGDLIVRQEDGGVIYPGQLDLDRNAHLINRRNIIIEHTTSSKREVIIYSRESIQG